MTDRTLRILLVGVVIVAAAVDSALSAPATAPAVKPAPEKKDAVRTLDAITIEGEIAVPQVLFIQSRDQRRFRDGLGKRYLVTALDATRCVAPYRLRAMPGSTTDTPTDPTTHAKETK